MQSRITCACERTRASEAVLNGPEKPRIGLGHRWEFDISNSVSGVPRKNRKRLDIRYEEGESSMAMWQIGT